MKKLFKWCILAAFLVLIAVYFFPKPLVRDSETCNIVSILYRANTWDSLRWFYPTEAEKQSINEDALLQLLHRSKAVRELIPSTLIDGIPSKGVTLLITVSDGGKIKYIILGDLNRVNLQGSSARYHILSSEFILNEALEILGIDKNTGLSMLSPIA